MENKDLLKYEKNKNIFYKIKMFFWSLFHKDIEEPMLVDDIGETQNKVEKEQVIPFSDKLKEQTNFHENLLKLKEKYDNGLVEDSSLTEDEVKGLINLYKEQCIKNKQEKIKLENRIREYDKIISSIKNLNS